MQMSYTPFYNGGWQSGENGGTPITPAALNHIDQGIIKHETDKSNPHGVTPAQIGAAPAGSVWTATDPNNDGNIVIRGGYNGAGNTPEGGGNTGGGLTAEEVQTMIDASLGVIENGTY